VGLGVIVPVPAHNREVAIFAANLTDGALIGRDVVVGGRTAAPRLCLDVLMCAAVVGALAFGGSVSTATTALTAATGLLSVSTCAAPTAPTYVLQR
jgi:hypothetical protein